LRLREHDLKELAFYSKGTSDIEYLFPFGWGELWGIASRTDYDLTQHSHVSKEDLLYLDPETNEKYLPYVIEPSLGLDRLALTVLNDAYEEEVLEKDTRIVLHLHPAIAPYKVAILPLSKQLGEKAQEVQQILSKHFMVTYDESGSIGKRYRRQDAIGTPYCVTIDFDTNSDQSVTIRERDSMKQLRMPIDDLIRYFQVKVFY
jgi:glycyl-tRNA synthetase